MLNGLCVLIAITFGAYIGLLLLQLLEVVVR